MKSVIIKIREADLNDNGRRLLALARHQDRHLAAILAPRDGVIYAELNDEDTDDILRVRVDDQLGHAERARRFGRAGRSPASVEQQEAMFGAHAMTPATRRTWFVPGPLIARARREPDAGAAIINDAGAALGAWCEEGGFTPWRDPDWISQTEAAQLAGVSAAAVRNAVADGRLSRWEDPDEPNPQRRTRVRRSEVLTRWKVQ